MTTNQKFAADCRNQADWYARSAVTAPASMKLALLTKAQEWAAMAEKWS